MKTRKLTGAALDWAVAKCEGRTDVRIDEDGDLVGQREFDYSTDWSQGGPIIEQENISITGTHFDWWDCDTGWYAHIKDCQAHGDTPLIAAMRCYVASKLGDEVEIPQELQ